MQMHEQPAGAVADAQRGNWVDRHAPEWLKPYARLARWDRPIGFWLLFWPCAFALALAALADPDRGFNWWALALCLVGAVAMRGAGCTFNDIVDRNIDDKVERTRSRPIPSGRVGVAAAIAFMVAQALVGLAVLLQFNGLAIALGVASLALVAIYPFMKRVTWWPQLFLGLAFSWGALLGWAAQMEALGLAPVLLYAGSILWVIGYDTIYAMQDIEDDALIGVRSTARLFGRRTRLMVALFYAGAVALWAAAAFLAGAGIVFVLGLAAAIAGLTWQVVTLDGNAAGNALLRFKANHWVGLAFTLALLAEAWL
ncbi:4-hydroxybenzoate octaprenyltransferase [Devosia sp.]|uniref:4-hydroxybenzoate octaprenyltransferase n=1 Tax=Devosia sp. TaxID=1871048 RepID=UPI002EEDC159